MKDEAKRSIIAVIMIAFLWTIVYLFNSFIKEFSDSLMVVITFVYVFATTEICLANIKSAEATQKQIEISNKQFQDTNRPYITCEYVLINRVHCGIRICNHGNKVAKNLKIRVNDNFISETQEGHYIHFKLINSSVYSLVGVGQIYDFYFCNVETKPKVPLIVNLTYEDDEKRSFSEKFEIDLSKQLPIMSVASDAELINKEMKQIEKQLQSIADKLEPTVNQEGTHHA